MLKHQPPLYLILIRSLLNCLSWPPTCYLLASASGAAEIPGMGSRLKLLPKGMLPLIHVDALCKGPNT